ncbi:hypothetical protein K2173_012447 [Erythroxylum novogranatense]|uniref:Proline-rich protein n=1 Tax=Erythroxylum novogranatense TaxID=1862640 RepID=A0AAV8TJ62_9ROSI|nr:hypothetical protein K2173_012447 [Erythroxylum novogranatense]
MEILVPRGALVCFFYVSLLFAATVVGIGECADCAQNDIKTSHAFSGLRVTIDCKNEKEELKTIGAGELDEEGKFRVSLPNELANDRKLKQECYAQLHGVSASPCVAHGGIESTKIVFKSETDGEQMFSPTGKLRFSPTTCTSAFLWPHFKHPKLKHPPLKSFDHSFPHHKLLPPLPKKPFPPKLVLPPASIYKYPPVPIYKPKPPVYLPPKVLPPLVPIYKPKPPVPIYKPKPRVYLPPKVLPPLVPIYKPKPPVPIYKPKPPVYSPPKALPATFPIYKPKPPVFHKPLPPLPKVPPFPKKPTPPLPKHPKIPPKYFHHPKFGKWPLVLPDSGRTVRFH